MKTPTLALVLIACALPLAPAHAAGPQIEPGLWEINITLKSQSGKAEAAMQEAQAQIARLPPDQRKAVEEMMTAQGVRLGNGTSTVQTCISPEDAARGEIPQQAGECSQQVLERGAKSMRVKFSCATNPPAKGEATVEFPSRTRYSSRAVVDTLVMGQPERMNVDQTGRWLAKDCGGVKPLGQ